MRRAAISCLSILLLVGQISPAEAVVTQLPAEGLEHLTLSELYPYWDQFYFSSPTFREAWDRANRAPRRGHEAGWNSITEGTLMLAQAYRHLVDGDDWWLERAPNLTRETYDGLRELALQVDGNRQARKLFFLTLYTRDLGWALTGRGQFHQQAGAPIVAQVLRELGYDDRWVELCEEWAANHSLPAEVYLGEVSPRTLEWLFDRFGSVEELPLLSMVALLSLMEVNCIRYAESGLCEANGKIIERIGRRDLSLVGELRTSRLRRIACAALLRSRASDERRQEVVDQTAERLALLEPLVTGDAAVERFLEEVNLHYCANTLPYFTPEAVALFLKESARLAVVDERCQHVMNGCEISATELGERILRGESSPHIDQERGWILWQE